MQRDETPFRPILKMIVFIFKLKSRNPQLNKDGLITRDRIPLACKKYATFTNTNFPPQNEPF